MDWLDKGLTPNEEGRGTIHEDDSTINHRVCRCISNATQERDIDSHRKGETPRIISSSSSSDDGDNGGSKGVGSTGEGTGGNGGIGEDGNIGGGYVSQVDPSMW